MKTIVIQKVNNNYCEIIGSGIFKSIKHHENYCLIKNVNSFLTKLIDIKKISLKDKLHYYGFINPVLVYSKLNIRDRKTKQFSKRYNYIDTFLDYPIERKAIASNFLSMFKNTKDLYYYYQYLYYCNRYNDFGKILLNIDESIDSNLINLTHSVE